MRDKPICRGCGRELQYEYSTDKSELWSCPVDYNWEEFLVTDEAPVQERQKFKPKVL